MLVLCAPSFVPGPGRPPGLCGGVGWAVPRPGRQGGSAMSGTAELSRPVAPGPGRPPGLRGDAGWAVPRPGRQGGSVMSDTVVMPRPQSPVPAVRWDCARRWMGCSETWSPGRFSHEWHQFKMAVCTWKAPPAVGTRACVSNGTEGDTFVRCGGCTSAVGHRPPHNTGRMMVPPTHAEP